ncbi:hypothetical protein BGZ51_009738 [Haplosporangium sp. Z 767]|nr:hypothetical protein BGZ50_009813 [Haplosporangium sp. Z 11]KAF9176736.1 hypothetical protein BGZ51_009738 [Haplosporangium sp. Z 767]
MVAPQFPGVKRASGSQAFYYDDNDINMINIPIGQCEGDFILTADELKRYFGLDASRMGKLPEYLITPRLNSTWNHNRSNKTGRSWWDITGEMVAYRPIEWVPVVRVKSTFPYSHFPVEFNKTTTTITKSELYGHFEASFTMSISGGWKSITMEASTTSSVEASYRTSTEVKEEITQKGTTGDVVVKEIMMGMSLRVERVYERSVNLYLNNDDKGDSLTWDGPESWDDLHVPASALRDVAPLQFHPIPMSGTGHSKSLFVQALPVFGANRRLTDMHLILSNTGWVDWYAYNGGTKTENSGRVETLPVPDNQKPLVTFFAA